MTIKIRFTQYKEINLGKRRSTTVIMVANLNLFEGSSRGELVARPARNGRFFYSCERMEGVDIKKSSTTFPKIIIPDNLNILFLWSKYWS